MWGIIVAKLKNLLWEIFSYFDIRVEMPNEQLFLYFGMLPMYFCSDLPLLTFSDILLYYSCFGVAIYNDVINF